MPANPDKCRCGSQLFTAVWSVTHKNGKTEELDPKKGNTVKKPVGFECIECGNLQLTREIPERHAEDNSLNMPDAADRDMVKEE